MGSSTKSTTTLLLELLGCNVNLGNIAPSEVISLEAMRIGLRGDTFELYLNKKIGVITREFGLIGYPLSHSFSQKYFTSKFEKEGIDDAVFHAFSIPSINDLLEVLRNHQLLKGFAITIPYKREVIPFLHYTSTEVKKMKACNCVQIKTGSYSVTIPMLPASKGRL